MIKSRDAKFTEDTFYQRQNVASTTDCTGLTPTAVLDEEESESYGELYAIHPPQPDKEINGEVTEK